MLEKEKEKTKKIDWIQQEWKMWEIIFKNFNYKVKKVKVSEWSRSVFSLICIFKTAEVG